MTCSANMGPWTCSMQAGHTGAHGGSKYIVGTPGGYGYRLIEHSSTSYTVEFRRDDNSRLIGSYSTKADALAGLARLRAKEITR